MCKRVFKNKQADFDSGGFSSLSVINVSGRKNSIHNKSSPKSSWWAGFRAALIIVVWIMAGTSVALYLWIRGGTSKPLPVYWEVPDFSLIERDGRQVTLADLKGKVWIANFIYTHCIETCPFQTPELEKIQSEFSGEKDLRLVSITVDPENDTPEVLSRYADKFKADPERWLFLTGNKRAIYRLAQKGFKLSVVDPEEGIPGSSKVPEQTNPNSHFVYIHPGPYVGLANVSIFKMLRKIIEPQPAYAHSGHIGKPFIHSSRFILVDRKAQVRGISAEISSPAAAPKGLDVPAYDKETLKKLRNDLDGLLRK